MAARQTPNAMHRAISSTGSENRSPSAPTTRRAAAPRSTAVAAPKLSLNSTARRPILRLPRTRKPLDGTTVPNGQQQQQPLGVSPKHGGKGTRAMMIEDESDGNKENIAPLRLTSILTLRFSEARRQNGGGGRKGVRFYSEAYAYVAGSLKGLDDHFSARRLHVIALPGSGQAGDSSDNLFEGDDDASDQERGGGAMKSDSLVGSGFEELMSKMSVGGVCSSPKSSRLTRRTTALEKDGKAVFRFGKPLQVPAGDSTARDDESAPSSSGDQDSSGSDSEDQYDNLSEDGLQEEESRVREVEDSSADISGNESDVDSGSDSC